MFFGSFLNRFIFAFSCYSSLLLCFFLFPYISFVSLFVRRVFVLYVFFSDCFFLSFFVCVFLFFLVFLFVVEMVGGGEGGVGASCSVFSFSLVLFESFCVSFAPSLS